MINLQQLYSLSRDAVMAWVDDFAPSMGAAIAYYTMFSPAPLLVIVIAVAGAIFGAEAAQGQIAAQLSALIGQEAADAVQGLIRSGSEPSRGLVAGAIGVGALLVGATTVFAELQSALDRIWHVPERQKPSGLWGLLRSRLLSFGLVLGLAFLLMVSLLVSAGLAAFGSWGIGLLPGWEAVLQVVNEAFSLVILTMLFAMIFKFMPSAPIGWRDVWIGAAVTAVLFDAGKLLIGLYLGKSGVTESFAAAGSLAVLLAWVYYAAQIFLLGAEFTKVYASAHGSASGTKAQAATEASKLSAMAGTDAVAAPGTQVGQDNAVAGVFIRSVPDASAIRQTASAQGMVDERLERAMTRLVHQVLLLATTTVVSAALARLSRRQPQRKRHRHPPPP